MPPNPTVDLLMTGPCGGFEPETNQKLTQSSGHKMFTDSKKNQTVLTGVISKPQRI